MKTLTPEEVNRIDVMGELFLRLLFEAPSSKNAMKNLVNFLEREEGKVFFFSILNQLNALNLLFYLLSTKDFFITRFRQTPELVDYIFQPQLIEEGVKEEKLKEFMESLKNLYLVKNIFEVVALLRFRLGRSGVSDFFKELTSVCDFVLKEVYSSLSPSFCVASLGKHGSQEMNVGSDLDLLFMRKGGESEEERAVELIKRLEELGYEVDTRLRPFGEKGELIFTLSYFKEYLTETARVWERLAFTRFRFLLGECGEEAEGAVKEFLFGKPLELSTLEEITKMRERLARELGRGKKDIKYASGGVVDLEFAAYIYQLLTKRWLRNTLAALKALGEEEERFRKMEELYTELRKAETEKRLFGDFIFYGAKIDSLKREVRESYEEFLKWTKKRLSQSI
jgi:glutamate-ammonia-ligase adenylyltransferase